MCRATAFLFSAILLTMTAGAVNAKVLIEIDKSAQQMVVSVDDVERYTWPVSTGRLGRDTPDGSYRAFRMERDHFSKEWDDAPMPHSIFFTKRGHAIHGSFEVNKIGTPASAGCVRLAPENAERLFALVEKNGVLNTTVVVTGDVQVALARQKATRSASKSRQQRVRRAEREEDLDAYAARMRQYYPAERTQTYPYVERRYGPRYAEPPAYYYDQYGRAYVPARRYRPYQGGWD